MMCEHARHMLHESLRSFHTRDVALATTTWNSAAQFAHHFDKVFADLVREGESHSRPVADLFSLMATFNRLERVIHQAKNICEETQFVGTGRLKSEKVFQILFVGDKNNGASQLAEHFTRKAFPQSGKYRSAGQLDEFHFVIGTHPDVRKRLGKVPFHTTVLVWDLGNTDDPEETWRNLTPKVRSLMEKLRGEQAC
jgi:hypothetical protein